MDGQKQKFDKRLIQRNMNRGILTPKEYESHLEGLNDMADNAEEFEMLMKDNGQEDESTSVEEADAEVEVEADAKAEVEIGVDELTSVPFGVDQ